MEAVSRPSYGGVDYFKLIAAILVITIHTGPLTSYNTTADFILTSIVARIAVPFYFIASGYFFFSKLTGVKGQDLAVLRRFSIHIGKLYLIAILLYLPLNVYAGYFAEPIQVSSLLKDLLFNGMFYHLWYLPALLLGMFIVYWLHVKMSARIMFVFVVTVVLYAIALMGDSYYGLTEKSSFLTFIYAQLFELFDYTRNGIGFAPLYIALGAWSSRKPVKQQARNWVVTGLIASMGMLLLEGILVSHAGFPRHDSMYVSLVFAVYCLFQLMLMQQWRANPFIRELSTWIYILHPIAIVLVRGGAKLTGLTEVFVKNSLVHFIAVTVLSVLMAAVLAVIIRVRKPKQPTKHRAWAEINLDHLEHNLQELSRVIPTGTRIMAVVKADAYGHGSIRISKRLNQAGVRSFAVAEIDEGIALRKKGIKGEIVILGYTPLNRLKELRRYRLTQTVINAEDAERLQSFGKKIKVQIKINTGMNRLGEWYDNYNRILSMYQHTNLQVNGTFSHLTSAESQQKDDVDFTRLQLERFDKAVIQVAASGYHPGTPHIQSSYGILNYPELSYGMVRPGIALYGMLSNENDRVYSSVELRPVMSLCATVTLVKNVQAGEPVGYNGSYSPSLDSTIATVSIGYADGIPREFSQQGGSVLIRGKRALIVGKICMDQMMVDVTDIDEVCQGDTATLIGQDGEEQITAGEIAKRVGTITNEVVSALSSRVNKVYIYR
ncbi:MAG: serine racemase VanT catalytic subunit [Candidatus Pristimantibacillus sp.]